MAIVDEQGRLFGRFNVVDAVVAVFVLGLVPLLYGAAVLFRTPPPTLTAIEPVGVTTAPGQRVTVRGTNLRPYMRVSFGDNQGRSFLFKSVHEAQVELNEMPPGVYDVVLYDVAQEQSRLPKAFTVLPSALPPTKITLVGVFGNLDATRAKLLKVGDVVTGVGTIRRLGEAMPAQVRINSNGFMVQVPIDKAVMVPADVEARCDMLPQTGYPYCVANGTSLMPTIIMMGEHAAGKLPFQIDQVRGPGPEETLEVVVRFTAPQTIIGAMTKGDVDRGTYMNPLASAATLLSINQTRPYSAAQLQADTTLTVQAERGSNGWVYNNLPLRAGSDFVFRTARYQVFGTTLSIRPEWTEKK